MKVAILFSSVGRRAQLIDCFRQAARKIGLSPFILGIDCDPSAPAAYLVDKFYQVPRCTEPEFLEAVCHICCQHGVLLVVPTIDPELPIYAAHSEEFKRLGTTVAVSHPDVVAIAADKVKTHSWLVKNCFGRVQQSFPQEVLQDAEQWRFPVVLKPRWGSASFGVQIVPSPEVLEALSKNRSDLIVEECAAGCEYTINVLANRNGKPVCAVPHLRLEVRAGEISKGITCKHELLIEMAKKIVSALPGAYGALNIQCFVDAIGAVRITEINARFGGGYPLAYRAGADFPRWILEELLQISSSGSPDNWEGGLTMLRYDDAVFLPNGTLERVGDE
jgi:carbamoyl-phosphate synthase large subunit